MERTWVCRPAECNSDCSITMRPVSSVREVLRVASADKMNVYEISSLVGFG